MSDRSLILIGGPDTGKTNYLARFWEAARSRKGALVAPALPGDVKYVENALAHLLQGEFAPRSDTNFEESNSFTLPVIGFNQSPSDDPAKIIVPDASGELWAKAVDQSELPPDWMKRLRSASGALLFVRVGSDPSGVSPKS